MAMKNLFFVTLIVATCMSVVVAPASGFDAKAAAAADPFFDPAVASMEGMNPHGAAAHATGATGATGAASPAAAGAPGAAGPAAAPGGAEGPAAASGEGAASGGDSSATTGGDSSATPAAHGSASPATLPAMGTLVGASLLTFIAYYLH